MNKIKELYQKYKEIINYLIFGVLTTVVSLVTYYICVFTVLNPDNAIQLQIANVISWIISVAFAYITNRKFVFESNEENKIKEALSKFELQVLHEYEKGKSYADIAAKLNAKVKSVDTAIQRIRKKANKIKDVEY